MLSLQIIDIIEKKKIIKQKLVEYLNVKVLRQEFIVKILEITDKKFEITGLVL